MPKKSKGKEKRYGAGARIFNGKKFLFWMRYPTKTEAQTSAHYRRATHKELARVTKVKHGWDVWHRKGRKTPHPRRRKRRYTKKQREEAWYRGIDLTTDIGI